MRGADDVAMKVFAQDDGIAPLHAGRHRLPNPGKSLMAVKSAQFYDRSVQRKSLRGKARLTEADLAHVVIEQRRAAQQPHLHAIELGCAQAPKSDGPKVVEAQ